MDRAVEPADGAGEPGTPTTSEFAAGLIGRIHAAAGRSVQARLILFVSLLVVLTGLLLALEVPHLGGNARLHWDAESSISSRTPTPRRDDLATARGHIFDIVTVTGVTDPAAATMIFNDPTGHFDHNALELVRLYYSQVSFAIAGLVFDTTARWTGSPVDAVLAFQLAGLLSISVSMSMLLTWCVASTPVGPALGRRIGMLFLAAAAIITCPILLSLARQLLTETVGFLWLIPSLMLGVWAVNPRRSRKLAVLAAAVAAGGLLLTLRTRYSMGPAIAVLVPLLLIDAVPLAEAVARWRHYAAMLLAALLTIALLVAVDFHFYGPMIFPWVYNDALVRSTRLFFHDFPPYKMFTVMLYNNAAMVLLPILAVVALVRGGAISTALRCYTAGALSVFLILIGLTARQQVGFQGRHLFALSGGCTLLMLLTIGRVHWTRRSGRWFAGVCGLFVAFNLFSTFWLETGFAFAHGGTPRNSPAIQKLYDSHPWFASTLNGFAAYHEGSDVARLHDGLITVEYLRRHRGGARPLLITDPSSDDGRWWAGRFAIQFDVADVQSMSSRFDPAVIEPIRAALASGRPVYLFTASRREVCPLFRAQPVPTDPLDTATLYTITGVDSAGYLAAVNGTASPAVDRIRITLDRGKSIRYDAVNWPRVDEISPEEICAFVDPKTVCFRVEGLKPGARYQLGLVTWDPNAPSAVMSVTQISGARTTVLKSAMSGGANPRIESTSMDEAADGSCEIRVTATAKGPVSIGEIWVRQVP